MGMCDPDPVWKSRGNGYDLHMVLRTVHGQSVTVRKALHHSPVQGLCLFTQILRRSYAFLLRMRVLLLKLILFYCPFQKHNYLRTSVRITKDSVRSLMIIFCSSLQKPSQQRTGARDLRGMKRWRREGPTGLALRRNRTSWTRTPRERNSDRHRAISPIHAKNSPLKTEKNGKIASVSRWIESAISVEWAVRTTDVQWWAEWTNNPMDHGFI